MDMDFMTYGLTYCTLATLLGVVIAIAIHLTTRSPRVRAIAQSGCFAALLSPALIVGHYFAIAPFWLAAYFVVSLAFTESRGSGSLSDLFLGLAWYAVTVLLPMLVVWVLLFTPALYINKHFAEWLCRRAVGHRRAGSLQDGGAG
jgi:hypothetical protein